MALHEQSVGATDEWYTPPHIFEALDATFDLDVAHPGRKIIDWIPATRVITSRSLEKEWRGFVWMNPPFGARTNMEKMTGIAPWLQKFIEHGNGIALMPDRTSAPWWQHYAPKMDVVMFCAPKIQFIDRYGNPGTSPAQGTALCALGSRALKALARAEGKIGTRFRPL